MENSIVIALVEDEESIQTILIEALTEAGYAAASATSGEEAMTLLERKSLGIRALITDVSLGRSKLTGWDVARRARELHPDLPVVYMTGDGGGDWASRGVPKSLLVLKPFAPAQIVTAVSQLLNEVG